MLPSDLINLKGITMRSSVAVLFALLPSVAFCQDEVEVVPAPAPMVFTFVADSYTGALLNVSQVFPSDPGALLQTPNVMSELELVDDQKKKLTSRLSVLAKEFQARNVELHKSFDGSPESGKKMEQVQSKYTEDMKAVMEDVLLPFQLDRLRQIRLQGEFRNGGSMAMESDSFTDLLKLTAEQKSELRKKAEAIERKLRSDFQIQRQKAHREVLEEVLNKKQLKTLDESLGKPMADVSK